MRGGEGWGVGVSIDVGNVNGGGVFVAHGRCHWCDPPLFLLLGMMRWEEEGRRVVVGVV